MPTAMPNQLLFSSVAINLAGTGIAKKITVPIDVASQHSNVVGQITLANGDIGFVRETSASGLNNPGSLQIFDINGQNLALVQQLSTYWTNKLLVGDFFNNG